MIESLQNDAKQLLDLCYMSKYTHQPSTAFAEGKDAFYSQLAHTLDRARNSDIVVLMGDHNAKLRCSNIDFISVLGKHRQQPRPCGSIFLINIFTNI